MLGPDKMMRVEVQQGDDWVLCEDFGALEKGDVIRWFHPDGRPAYDGRTMLVETPPAITVDSIVKYSLEAER